MASGRATGRCDTQSGGLGPVPDTYHELKGRVERAAEAKAGEERRRYGRSLGWVGSERRYRGRLVCIRGTCQRLAAQQCNALATEALVSSLGV